MSVLNWSLSIIQRRLIVKLQPCLSFSPAPHWPTEGRCAARAADGGRQGQDARTGNWPGQARVTAGVRVLQDQAAGATGRVSQVSTCSVHAVLVVVCPGSVNVASLASLGLVSPSAVAHGVTPSHLNFSHGPPLSAHVADHTESVAFFFLSSYCLCLAASQRGGMCHVLAFSSCFNGCHAIFT